MSTNKIIFLYIKLHKITGLKYFGRTTSKNPFKYSGSGKYWKNHCNKYGWEFVKTIEIWGFDCQIDCTNFAINFSIDNDITKSELWANQMIEDGCHTWQPGNGPDGSPWSEERRIRQSKLFSGSGNPNYGKTMSDKEKLKRSLLYSGSGNPNYGKIAWNNGQTGVFFHSKETIERLKYMASNRTKDHQDNLSKSLKGRESPTKGVPAPRVSCIICKRETDIRNFGKHHKHDGTVIKNPPYRCSCIRCGYETTVRALPRHRCKDL